jgi:CSLREA domain-containing protein
MGLNLQQLVSRFCIALLAVVIAQPGNLSGLSSPTSIASLTPNTTYTVNTTLDTLDVQPANGICADVSGKCSLRAAIMAANLVKSADTIILPAGVYQLTRAGYDDAANVGDLDILDDLTLQGAGSGVTIVDGNGALTGDRVFQVLSTADFVTLSGMTIRNGRSLSITIGTSAGGGILMEGAGNLLLSDVLLDSNTASAGGGLCANLSTLGGSVTMDHSIVHANKASAGAGEGGGVLATFLADSSTLTVQDTKVYSNTAGGLGGGFVVSGSDLAHWSIARSEIYSNTAASAGAIGNFMPLTLSDSSLHNNRASIDGGAIESFSPLTIMRTTLAVNSALRFGGGIFSEAGGTSALYHKFANIAQSTISGNSAQYGGGIYHTGFYNANSLLTLENSTLTGNVVYLPGGATGRTDGGGLYAYGGQTLLRYATIANNMVLERFPVPAPGIGGGLYITATAVLTAEASIIADNTRGNGITPSVADDCFSSGTTGELSYDLFTTMANCFVTGGQFAITVGQDPLLGLLQFNGGLTKTKALLTGSPAIDAIPPNVFCVAGVTNDQRGGVRAGGQHRGGSACDLGAYELDGLFPYFMPQVIK